MTDTAILIQSKPLWLSKTFWVNVVTVIAVYSEVNLGIPLDSNTQLVLLALANLGLRKLTNQPISWS